jgi:hypothetical protein
MAEMTTTNAATEILQDLIIHARDFAVESAKEWRSTDAFLWHTQAEALSSLLETHRLVPVAVAEAALWVLESDRFDLNHPPRESLPNGWTFCKWSDEEISACKSLAAALRGGDSHAE